MREAIAADIVACRFEGHDYYKLGGNGNEESAKCTCDAMDKDRCGYFSYIISASARALCNCIKKESFKELSEETRKELIRALDLCDADVQNTPLKCEQSEVFDSNCDDCFEMAVQTWRSNDGKLTYFEQPWQAAIRAIPAAYVGKTEREVVQFARTIARVTHRAKFAVLGAEALSVAIYLALCGHTKQEIKETVAERYYPSLKKTIREWEKDGEKIPRNAADGTVGDALAIFFRTGSYKSALKKALMLSDGGYPYLVCLTGTIAGAFYEVQDLDALFKNSLTEYVRGSLQEFEELSPVRLVFSIKHKQDNLSLSLGERLACALNDGDFARRDTKSAGQLAQKLMRLGSQQARNVLAKQLIYGEYSREFGVETGLKMLEANSLNDDAVACLTLGEYYLSGRGISVDTQRAFSYFSRGVESDDYCCYLPYIKCIAFGWGTKKDEKKAYDMLKEYIDDGIAFQDAYALFGRFCEQGIGIAKPDYKQACYYYMLGLLDNNDLWEQIASQKYSVKELAARYDENKVIDNAESENGLGRLYEKGHFLRKNKEQAYRHYLRASELGDSLGTYNLARCYLDRIYVKQDISKAMSLMKKAVKIDSGIEGKELALAYEDYCLPDDEKEIKRLCAMYDNLKNEKETDADDISY